MLAQELKAARDYIRRAHELFMDAMEEPNRATAELLFKLGNHFLEVAQEIERAVEEKLVGQEKAVQIARSARA
jgi:hypothetical protein